MREDKIHILRVLGQEKRAMGVPELLFVLGDEYKERSVRRYLQQLIEEGLVEKQGQKRGTKYLLRASSSADPQHVDHFYTPKSISILKKLQKPVFERPFVAYSKGWLDAYEPNKTFYLPKRLRKEFYEVGTRGNGPECAGTYAHKIYHRLIIDLSYHSSRLEGNTYSYLETEKLLDFFRNML